MLSDEQKKLVKHAAEVLRTSAAALTDAYDIAESTVVATIIDARDTADKLEAMVSPKKSTGVSYEVGSGSRDLDETKPQGLTRHMVRIAADETELAQL
jgi:hypothetical protein